MRLLFLTVILGLVLIHCSKAALTTQCTIDDDCEQNSSCGDDKNCACNDGFKLNTAEDGCVAKVLEDVCDETNGCTGLLNTDCTGGKCVCTSGYAEKNSMCTKTVSGTTCSANGNECSSILNSHCDAEKCKCNDGFVMNVDVCAADTSAGSGTTCTAAGTECDSIDNSHCDAAKCKCNDGFVMNADVCTVDTSGKVTDTGCTKDAADQCKHTTHAECDNAETGAKCKCSEGYAEDRTNGKTCMQTVSGTTCTAAGTECDGIDNSHCDTDKCKCNDGYVMNVEVCTAENAATHVQLGVLTLYLSFGLAMAQKLF